MPPKQPREFTVRVIDYGRCKSDEEFEALRRLAYAEAMEIFAEVGIVIEGEEVSFQPPAPDQEQANFELPVALFADFPNRAKIGMT